MDSSRSKAAKAQPRDTGAERPAAAAPKRMTAERALVVDGDPASSALCKRILGEMGYEVETVDHGVAAVKAARQQRPGIVMLALQLRDATGVEVAGWFKSDPELAAIPVIGMSALGTTAGEGPARRLGFDAIIRKPVSAASVKRAVQGLES